MKNAMTDYNPGSKDTLGEYGKDVPGKGQPAREQTAGATATVVPYEHPVTPGPYTNHGQAPKGTK